MTATLLGAVLALLGALGLSAEQTHPSPPAGPSPRLIRYFISEGKPSTGFQSPDRELAQWALEAWQRSAGNAIRIEQATEQTAIVKVFWAAANGATYGETRRIVVNGQPGAEIFVMADTDALGPEIANRAHADPLWRDTIVYLTCLHELGHALGLSHTTDYRDIMYFFGYGGDIVEYFARYRRQLHQRTDIRSVSGLSQSDVRTLLGGSGLR